MLLQLVCYGIFLQQLCSVVLSLLETALGLRYISKARDLSAWQDSLWYHLSQLVMLNSTNSLCLTQFLVFLAGSPVGLQAAAEDGEGVSLSGSSWLRCGSVSVHPQPSGLRYLSVLWHSWLVVHEIQNHELMWKHSDEMGTFWLWGDPANHCTTYQIGILLNMMSFKDSI